MKKDEQLGVSRRSFLKGAGLAAAAMAGTAALAGCANESAGGADTLANTGDWLPQTWDYECDLLVIGYGGAGMWASLIGADECGQQVLVLEKAPERGGGNSSINNGEWTIVEESEKERFKDYIRAFTKGKTPDAMIEAWVEECARNTEYADKYGMTYEVVEQALAGAIPEYFFLDDNAYEGSCKLSSVDGFGMLSFHELDAQREALGVEVLFDCHDERLIQNPQTKEIVGAYTMIGNEEKTVKARKAVIMTLGGFEFNEELKNQYLKCSPFKFEGWCFNTGDGIKMVEDVGAKLWHMDMAISMYVSATAKSAERATLSRRRRPRFPAGGATALWPPALPRAAAQGALDRGVVEVRGPDLNLQRRGALGVPGRDRPARDLPSAELREPDRHRDVLCAERGQPPRGVRGPHDCPLSGSPSPSAASASRSFMR